MQIGVKEDLDYGVIKYYDSYYDVLPTPNFDDKSRLLIPKHGMQTVGNSKDKICRFCHKNGSEVSFKKVAHVFPESIGNNVLSSNYECDTCNQYFGNTIENEYGNFFSLYHSVMQIKGKKGIPRCSYKIPCALRTDKCLEHCVDVDFKNGIPFVRQCKEVGNQYIRFTNNEITISKPAGKHCPIAVFKAIVKMAISVMPEEELPCFSNAIKWILNPEHSNIYDDKRLLVRYKMIPGFNVTKYPHYMLFRRKRTIWNKPYMLFNLTYGCFSLFVEIPRDSDNNSHSEFLNLPFPEIPFHTSLEGVWDLSQKDGSTDFMHSITLSFDNAKECTNDVDLCTEKGKSKIFFKEEL